LVIYLDTSAFLKLYVREEGSQFVQGCLEEQDHPVPIPDILRFEFLNALRLKVFWNELTDGTVDHLLTLFDDRLLRGQYAVVEIDAGRRISDFRHLTSHSSTLGCRTLDVLHVATALQLRPDRFITFDDRQRSLATAAGLSVQPAESG
jgi:predicted nucleic acid-binding protein